MKKKTKTLIISMLIFITIISIGVYNVLAGLKFEAKIEANDVVVNETGEEITFIVSSDDLVETGLASGQFYIEYDSDIFSVIEDGIEYLQHSSNFSNSKSETTDGKGKITVLYYDNSDDLNQPLVAGDLFSITLTVKNMSIADKETITISGEGFSTIQDDEIVDMEGKFTSEDITFRERNILVNNLTRSTLNADYGKPIYNGETTSLALNVIATDIDENNKSELYITRSYKYGDINIDGIINEEDLEILRKDEVNNIKLTDVQNILADLDNDGSVNSRDNILLLRYLSDWKLESQLGEIHEDLSTLYYIGDLDLNGVVDDADATMLSQYLAKWEINLNDIQLELIDLNNDGEINSIDATMLSTYLENGPINNINKTIVGTKYLYGDIYLDGKVNHKDVQLLKLYLETEPPALSGALNPYSLSAIQEMVADIDKNGIVDADDLTYLENYYLNLIDTKYSNIGKISNQSNIYVYGDLNNDKTISYEDYEILNNQANLTETQIELSSFSSDNELTNLDILKIYLDGINYEGHRIGLNYNPTNNNTNVYGDLNLDGKITTNDIDTFYDLYLGNTQMNYQSHLNMFGGEYRAEFILDILKFSVDWYGEDVTISNYISETITRIGSIEENTEMIYGDPTGDGEVDIGDAIYILRYVNNLDEMSDEQKELADINEDGIVDLADFHLIVLWEAHYSVDSIVNMYLEAYNRIGTATPEYVNDRFTIETVGFHDESITVQNFSLITKDTIETGIYSVIVGSTNGEESIMSNVYEFAVEPKPVSELAFDEETYTVGIDCQKETSYVVLPSNAYNKNVSFSIKDSNIATVDENGKVTGVSAGETYLYINSMDGSVVQNSAKIVVVEKNIALSNVVLTPFSTYPEREEGIYDKDGGTIDINIDLQNIDSSELTYELIKQGDNERIDMAYLTDIIFYSDTEDGTTKLRMSIPSLALDYGVYDFKVKDSNGIESNVIEIEILKYVAVTYVDALYNGVSVDTITIAKGDSIIIDTVVNQDATNIGLSFENGNSDYTHITIPTLETLEITGKAVGSTTMKIISDCISTGRKEKTVVINVIEQGDSQGTQVIKSNINNKVIDEKFGGTITKLITFNNFDTRPTIEKVEIYKNGLDLVENIEWIETNQIDNSTNLKLTIGEDVLSSGDYVAKYYYKLNDTKQTLKEGTFEFTIHDYIPVTTITSELIDLTLIKGTKYTIHGIGLQPLDATYKELLYASNNDVVSVEENGEITANKAGITNVTVMPKDNQQIKATVNVTVIDYDLNSDKHSVDINDNKIRKINDKLTHSSLMKNITKYGNITTKAFKEEIEMSESDLIGTGSILKTYLNDKLFNEYTMIVSGDLNGDGKVLANDILVTKMHILEKSTLDGIYFEAGDINDDKNVNARDILSMKMYILEKTNNVWGE